MQLKATSVPDIFKHPDKHLESFKKTVGSEVIGSTARAINQDTDSDVVVHKATPTYLVLTEKTMLNRGIIDLKEYFKNSPHVKLKKNGGWYLVIPLTAKTRQMHRKAYDQLRDLTSELGNGESTTVAIDSLRTGNPKDTLASLAYTPKSNSVTAFRSQSGTRTGYVQFRTVSDKSAPNSWLLNRGNMTSDNTSKTLQENVRRLMDYKVRQMTSK